MNTWLHAMFSLTFQQICVRISFVQHFTNTHLPCSNCRGVGGLNPLTSSCRPPYLWSKFDPGGVKFQPPHLCFAEVGMLLDSHSLPMQFLKYLQCDDLNVTTIFIHIEDYGLFSPGLSVKFY